MLAEFFLFLFVFVFFFFLYVWYNDFALEKTTKLSVIVLCLANQTRTVTAIVPTMERYCTAACGDWIYGGSNASGKL